MSNDRSITPFGNPDNPLEFNFEGHEIRVIQLSDGDLLFVASDICAALGLVNTARSLARLDDDEKGIHPVNTPGGIQQMAVTTEPGLYALVSRSDKQAAKRFQRWVNHDVLPSIRKTGSYTIEAANEFDMLRRMIDSIEYAAQTADQALRLSTHTASRVEHIEVNTGIQQEYFTIVGYFRYKGREVPPDKDAREFGRLASKLSRERGVDMTDIPDTRFGHIRAYHISILDGLFG